MVERMKVTILIKRCDKAGNPLTTEVGFIRKWLTSLAERIVSLNEMKPAKKRLGHEQYFQAIIELKEIPKIEWTDWETELQLSLLAFDESVHVALVHLSFP